MTATHELAARALAPLEPSDRERLRALTLTNVAAGTGALGAAGLLLEKLPLDSDRPLEAAFLHAARLHARTQDDFHPFGRIHVGVVALGATLAVADRARERLLECLAAGYEVMCAAATAYSRKAQRRGYRPTGVFGPLGAAAAASVALELESDGVANAIGLAAARSGGTMQSWLSGTDEWLLEVGAAARAGVEAALFTEAGAVASPEALEGPAGWARAYFDDDGQSLQDAVARSGSYISEVAAKPYPVSGIAQVPTELARRAHEDLNGHPVQAATLRLSEPELAYPGSTSSGPFRSRSDALMSVGFCVACALTDGAISMARLERPNELIDLAGAIRLEPDSALEESEAILTLEVGGELREYIGNAAGFLDPEWAVLAQDPTTLATRTEADPVIVGRIADLLGATRPDARCVAAVLGGAQ